MIRIKKINIKQFGNIKDFVLETGGHKATVIFGDNESGKTMILDAILDALFSVKKLKAQFTGVDKYIFDSNSNSGQDSPLEKSKSLFDGTVELEVDELQMVFPEKESLDEIMSISPLDARNLFVVREGEIDISKQDNWWSGLKNRLSGDSGDCNKSVGNISGITGSGVDGELINSSDHQAADHFGKLNNQLRALLAAKNDIRELATLSKQKDEFQSKLGKCLEKIDEQKNARKAFQYLEGKKLVSKYSDIQKKSVELEKYRCDKLKIWRNTEIEITKANQILALSRKHRNELSNATDKNVKDIDDGERKIAKWEKLEKEVISALETKLVDYKYKETKIQRGATGNNMLFVWIILCAISSISITFVSLLINPVFFPVAGILYITLGFSVKNLWSSQTIKGQLQSLEREIKAIFRRIDKEEKGINDINDWLIENRNRNLELKRKMRLAKENELPDVDNISKELTASINTLDSKLRKLCNFTDALKISTGCPSWEDLQAKCNEKETLKVSMDLLSDQINQLLDTKYEEEWEVALCNLAPFVNVKVEWNEKLLTQLGKLSEQLSTQIKTSNDRIDELKIKIAELEYKTEEDILKKEDAVRAELSKLGTDKSATLTTNTIVENASQEQDMIVNNVIANGHGSAANLFSAITDKRYERVFLENNIIYVKNNKSDTIPINHLSSGARAQLYFALRVNLAQSLLGERAAFLLLDDPFLSCDKSRTNEMVNILQEMTEKGWQLIYFTLSESIVEIFENRFKEDLNICRL